ncbi:hypothetical protein DY000_02008966, partial [Brassica cretica]
ARGVSLKGNTYWFSREPFEVADFLICFDFTTERFGPRLSLPFHTGFECTVTLSSVREEQLAVLLQVDYLLRMEIWVTTKIEPEEVFWNKLFFAVNMEPFLDFQFGMSQGSFFLDQEKRVVVVFDKDTDMRFTRNIYSLCHWREWIFQTSRSRRICRISSSFWVLICQRLKKQVTTTIKKVIKGEYELH